MIRVTHNCGFFSNCSVRLASIILFFNQNKAIPACVDSSKQFGWYKNEDRDITFDYFEHYTQDPIVNDPLKFTSRSQYLNYKTLDFQGISPFVRKYFSPSTEIKSLRREIEEKYNIDYENTCVLFYRGNDKATETRLCSYDDMSAKASQILLEHPQTKFLIQSDETEFIETMTPRFPSFYFKDEIRHMPKQLSTVDKIYKGTNYKFSKYYLAITIIMSKCKFIVCGTGNCSLWIMLYRENADNIYQFIDGCTT